MPGSIVELDRMPAVRPVQSRDRMLIAGLALACGLFGLAVWLGPSPGSWTAVPAERSATVALADQPISTVRLPDLRPSTDVTLGLGPPWAVTGVVLSAMPDRYVNEPLPATLRRIVTVRGLTGLASVEGPATVLWSEGGTMYWLASPTLTIEELILLADEMR